MFSFYLFDVWQYIYLICNNIMTFIIFQGVSYDHIELNYYVNGKAMEKPITGIKGTVYPVLFGMYYTISLILGSNIIEALYTYVRELKLSFYLIL